MTRLRVKLQLKGLKRFTFPSFLSLTYLFRGVLMYGEASIINLIQICTTDVNVPPTRLNLEVSL